MNKNASKKYIDKRGWKYQVMPGLGENTFKARYQKADQSGACGWHALRSLPWQPTFERAQADLDTLALDRSWKEWDGNAAEDM